MNGDGKSDIVAANPCLADGTGNCSSDGVVGVLLADGDGIPSRNDLQLRPVSRGVGTVSMAVADVNGDGKPLVTIA